ncbi:MAG: hypothetical protein IT361_04395 [Gemmatimonadaceae bacterium]|nr:hypothetical protein [Gemmatimonadaceae bacterium]
MSVIQVIRHGRARLGAGLRSGIGRGLRRAQGRPTRAAALVAFLMGTSWVATEVTLRGGEGGIVIDWMLVTTCAMIGTVVGLGTRGRMTTAGEVAANTELAELVVLAMFMLPALMLVVYGVALLLSAGIVTAEWAVWVVAITLSVLLQLTVYALAIGMLVAIAEAGIVGLVGVVVYIVFITAMGLRFAGDGTAAWDFTITRWVGGFREGIQPWTFVVTALRRALAPLDHGALMSVLGSVVLGALLALGGALTLRGARRALMRYVRLRPYLPMGAAPVPDSVPLIDRRLLFPAATYIALLFGTILVVRVF